MTDITIFKSYSGLVKLVELLCLIVAMATYFSLHYINKSDTSSTYFVACMIVSSFLQTSFLLLVYVFGGLVIQKTLYELMVNSFYCLMLLVTAIVLFALGNIDSGTIASGVFTLFAMVAYGVDSYLSLINMGAMQRADPAAPINSQTPNLPTETRSQPFTPPPAYNPPASLVGPGPYGSPNANRNSTSAGDLGGNR
ncbi:Marvel domain, partial [Trinorchestia longiramus]